MGMDKEMRSETCPVVRGLYNRLRTKTYNNPYKLIAEFMTDENLQEIGKSTKGEDTLLWVSHKLDHNSRYLFWERILRNRQCFSDAFRASIWFELFTDCGNLNRQRPVEADGTESDFRWGINDLERLSKSIITSPYLLDSATVVKRYCEARKKGWQTLRYLRSGRTWRTLPGWARIRQEITDDFVPGFEMGREMLGGRLSFSVIAEILNCGAWNIFRHLLENDLEELEQAIPLEEVACYMVAQFPDSNAIAVLEMLEAVRPGLVGGFRDAFGQNLLWYAMVNPRSCWFHPNCRLTPYLLEHGCSAELPTNIGLSWRLLTDSLSDRQKNYLWSKRLTMNKEWLVEQPNLWRK